MSERTFTRAQCLASMAAVGCRRIGRDVWTDGAYRYVLTGTETTSRLTATRIGPAPEANVGMREALRPLFLAAHGIAA